MLAAFWRRDFDLESTAQLESSLVAAGLHAGEWREYLHSTAQRELEMASGHAERLGVFGAPTFVCQGELFWGGDRLDLLATKLEHPGVMIGDRLG